MVENELEFTVDSQLLGELGERLVTRNYIALSELIKNAYDADATKAIIRFVNAKRHSSGQANAEIQLIDDGHGMIFEEVKDYWMRIATPYKVREPISPIYGRKKTGNKGIGRFACRRLARRLVLQTTAKVTGAIQLEMTRVVFDWKKFKPGTTLTEIPCEFEKKRLLKGHAGLKLKLIDLTDKWTESEFNLLRRKLLTLSIVKGIRRKGFKEDPGFEIVFDAPEFSKGDGILVDQFMDAGWGKLEGRIGKSGVPKLILKAKKIGTKKHELPMKFKDLSNVNFEIAWIPHKKDYFRDTSTLTKGLAEHTREQGGVRVFLDGFRIYPYGDPGDDWLGIDRDVVRRWGKADDIFQDLAAILKIDHTRAMLNHPQNRHLIGRVFLSSYPKSLFIVKADREGFVRNKAYEDLISCLRLSLQWCVLHYDKFLYLYETEALKEAEEKLRTELGEVKEKKLKVREIATPLIDRAVNVLSLEAKRAQRGLSKVERKKSEERVEAAAKVIQHSFTRGETYLNMLRAVASTGALMFVFTHEIKGLIARLDTHSNTLSRIVKNLPKNERPEFKRFAQSLRETRDRFDEQVRLFGVMAQKTKDTVRKEISIKKTCQEVLNSFKYLIKHYDLDEPIIDVPSSLRTVRMLDAEFFSIVVNLISNAIKAVLAGRGRRILIQARKDNGKTAIRVFDDGVGLAEDVREKVFEPLTADPYDQIYKGLRKRIQDEELAALGRGSGLGLNIVRGIVETYGGKANFVNVEPPWKTCAEVILP